MKSPFAQPEKSRVANVTIAKSRVLAAQVLRILSRKGFGTAKPIANLRAQVVGAFSLSSPGPPSGFRRLQERPFREGSVGMP
jgi:hypothetical protein